MKLKILYLLFLLLTINVFSEDIKVIFYPLESMMTPDIHRYDFRLINEYEKKGEFEKSKIALQPGWTSGHV